MRFRGGRRQVFAAILIFGVLDSDDVAALPLSFVHNLCDRQHSGPSENAQRALQTKRSTELGKVFMAQIFDRSSNALARMSLVLTGLIVIALGVTLDELQRSPWVTRQGQRADQPVPFSHKHHVQGLGLQCQYCHTSVEKSSYAGIPPTRTCMNCHAQIWTNAQLLEPVRQSWY